MSSRHYTIYAHNGDLLGHLNPELVEKQGINDEQLCALKVTHQVKEEIFSIAKCTNNILALKALAKVFDALEFEQQKLWNFKEDDTMHRFFDFPGCTCPRLDNIERLGIPHKVYSGSCPIHGNSE